MPKKPLTLREVQAVLEAPDKDRSRLLDVLKALPEDVDPTLASRAARSLIPKPPHDGPHITWTFARTCRKLPAPVIHALLEQLEEDRRSHAFFLREAVPRDAGDAELTAAWAAALQALLDLDSSYAWGSMQRKAKLQALAREPRMLQAIQTAAVACEAVSLDMLAVLAADASEASIDALIPHVERAMRLQDQNLDRLQLLRTHARSTPVLNDFFARIQAQFDTRQAHSPALRFARELGFGERDTFWFRVYLMSDEREVAPAYRYHAHMSVDSSSDTWFSISVSKSDPTSGSTARSTSFTSKETRRDELELGTCEPAGLPAWLARAEEKLGVRWDHDEAFRSTSLRGTKRARLEQWLRGA
jgi:hypothetical protein